MSTILSLLTPGVQPTVLALVIAIVLVTVIALFRAPRNDAHRVYTSFTKGFGIRRPGTDPESGPVESDHQIPDPSADDQTDDENGDDQAGEA